MGENTIVVASGANAKLTHRRRMSQRRSSTALLLYSLNWRCPSRRISPRLRKAKASKVLTVFNEVRRRLQNLYQMNCGGSVT